MLDRLVKEPFLGFTEESINFLSKLKNKKYNNKKWFDIHRDEYETYLKLPMRSLIDALSPEINKIDENIVINYKSIFRINRDIRFSKDKTPYKTQVSASFCFDIIKKPEIPQFYFHINPDELLIAGGQYSTDMEKIKKIRNSINENYGEFKKIIADKKFIKEYKTIEGEKLSKLPKGYENIIYKKEAALPELLKMKQYYVFITLDVKSALDNTLINTLIYHFKLMYNFMKFLNDATK